MEKPYYLCIAETLPSVNRPEVYAAGGEVDMPLPGISLAEEPDIILGLPLCEAQAKHLSELQVGHHLEEESKQLLTLQFGVHGNLTPHSSLLLNPSGRIAFKSCYIMWR